MNKGRDTKPHIGIFGRRNNGKSSLINTLTGQDIAIVSEVAGTTTDPVKKSIEIAGIGPVVMIDTAGIEAIHRLHDRLHKQGGTLMFAGIHDNVCNIIKRSGLTDVIGEENFFWSSDQAIVEAEKRGCQFCSQA